MIYVILGILVGVIVGLKTDIYFSPLYAVYLSMLILAIVNTIFKILANTGKKEVNFKTSMIYLMTDVVIALILGFVGEQLGLPLYLAAIFAFGNNIYTNVNLIINSYIEKKNI